jgi:Zinc knuckle
LVRDYAGDVQAAVDELELSIPAAPHFAYPELLLNRPDNVVIGVANAAWLRGEINRYMELGYQRFRQPVVRNIFIDGLLPHLRSEVLRQNPGTLVEALDQARTAELNATLQTTLSRANHQAVEEVDVEALHRQRGYSSNRGQSSTRGRGRTTSGAARPGPTCYYCDKKGHVQKECFKRQREKGAYKPPPRGSVHGVEGEDPTEPPQEAQTTDTRPEEQYVNLNSLSAYLNW